MKKFTLGLMMIVCFGLSQANAQNFDGKNIDFGVGVGLGPTYAYYGDAGILPIFAQIDFGVWDKISVGGTVGFSTSKFLDERYSNIYVGARGNYHWGKHVSALPESLDLYAGLSMGYNISNVDALYGSYGGFFVGGQAGGRWFFKENLAAFAEVGYSIAYLKIGIDFRLR